MLDLKNMKIDFINLRKVSYAASILMVLVSMGSFFFKNINFGIDFTGGSIIEIKTESTIPLENIHSTLKDLNLGEIKAQNSDDNIIIIKTSEQRSENIDMIKQHLKESINDSIIFRKVDFVGPQIGSELITQSSIAITLSFLAILAYVAFRFNVSFGIGIVAALLHDTVVTIGFINIFDIEFDLTTIAAILTIIGYSVNDSVVIYDRIRENIRKHQKQHPPLFELINTSINETLSRTTLTSSTTLVAVLSLIVFGGPALFNFSVIVFVGIVIGTYSSIFISAPLLLHLNTSYVAN